jgi:hypothetical protein
MSYMLLHVCCGSNNVGKIVILAHNFAACLVGMTSCCMLTRASHRDLSLVNVLLAFVTR